MAKVLIADDSKFMREVIRKFLTSYGVEEFVEAENGKYAIDKYKIEKPDLVTLDMVMPEINGLGVLKEIIPLGAKVIVVSAVSQPAIVNEAKELGAISYVTKPIEESELRKSVSSVINIKE